MGIIVFGTMAFIGWCGWKLGVLEAVVLVMVIGLSIDYTVHLSDAYLENEKKTREERTQAMLTHLGESVLSGAISTIGASVFLLATYNQFFYKFGLIILFVISTSVIFSMVFFAAALDTIGPNDDFGNLYALPDWRACLLGKKKEKVTHVEMAAPDKKQQVAPDVGDMVEGQEPRGSAAIGM